MSRWLEGRHPDPFEWDFSRLGLAKPSRKECNPGDDARLVHLSHSIPHRRQQRKQRALGVLEWWNDGIVESENTDASDLALTLQIIMII
jgi:hypothetical protein